MKSKNYILIQYLIILFFSFVSLLSCKNTSNESNKVENEGRKSEKKECILDGNYYWSDNYQSFEVNIIGDSWYGELTDLNTQNVLSSAAGYVQNMQLLGENGENIGYIYRNCSISVKTMWGTYTLRKSE